MATIHYYGDTLIDFHNFFYARFWDIYALPATSTAITGLSGPHKIIFGGNFELAGDLVSGGTITSARLDVGFRTITSITGLSLDIADVARMTAVQFQAAVMKGDDTLTSAWNEDERYFMGGGNDWLRVGSGNDRIDGGTGIDTLVLEGRSAAARFAPQFNGIVEIVSGSGRDSVQGIEILAFADTRMALHNLNYSTGQRISGDSVRNLTHDIIIGTRGLDMLTGLTGNDLLYGGNGGDTLDGGFGRDRLVGGGGGDALLGGAQGDFLMGQGGNDQLTGGRGDDILTGGGGRDIFVFGRRDGRDTITDFQPGQDRIEIVSGARDLSDLAFTRMKGDTAVSFANVTILVEDVLPGQLNDAAHFLF